MWLSDNHATYDTAVWLCRFASTMAHTRAGIEASQGIVNRLLDMEVKALPASTPAPLRPYAANGTKAHTDSVCMAAGVQIERNGGDHASVLVGGFSQGGALSL